MDLMICVMLGNLMNKVILLQRWKNMQILQIFLCYFSLAVLFFLAVYAQTSKKHCAKSTLPKALCYKHCAEGNVPNHYAKNHCATSTDVLYALCC